MKSPLQLSVCVAVPYKPVVFTMQTFISIFALLTTGVIAGHPGKYVSRCYPKGDTSTLDYPLTDIHKRQTNSVGNLTSGALTLVVNVATYCRLTLHYLQLNKLLEDNVDMSVLAFPCDQFGHQEPGINGTEILSGLRHVRPGGGFEPHPRLHMLSRGDVNGPKEAPLYTYLKSSCPQPSSAIFKSRESFWDPIKPNDVSWNFEKFLVSGKGLPLYRFLPNVEPLKIQPIIRALTQPHKDPSVQSERLKKLLNELDESVDRGQ